MFLYASFCLPTLQIHFSSKALYENRMYSYRKLTSVDTTLQRIFSHLIPYKRVNGLCRFMLWIPLEKVIQNKDYWCVEVFGYNNFILFLAAAIYHHLIVVCKHWGSYWDIKEPNALFIMWQLKKSMSSVIRIQDIHNLLIHVAIGLII